MLIEQPNGRNATRAPCLAVGGPRPRHLRPPARAFLADEEPVFLEGLCGVCSRVGLTIVGLATVEHEVIPFIARERPDVAVLGNLVGPIGRSETIRQVVENSPHTNVLILTTIFDARRLATALHAGARGIAPRWLTPVELLCALQEVEAGRTYVWRGERRARVRVKAEDTAATSLTSREYDVLGLIADGKSFKQIAEVLGIAPRTVEHHREHICEKLAVQTTAHLVRCAVRMGLVTP